jgi:hypothetical protein
MERKKASHPAWALAYKRKGTELRLLGGKYYLYEVSSKWNPEKKRSVKITGKLLGKISESEGFVESEKARLRKQQLKVEQIQVKEYGVASLWESLFTEILPALKDHFPDTWQDIICLTYGRLVYQAPLKNMSLHYCNSYLSVQYPDIDLSAKHLSSFLRELGRDRERIVRFCRSFKITEDCVLFDGTDIFSHSAEMELPKLSKSKFGTYDEMINLMCLFSTSQQMPVYYRLLPGNIKDVSAFRLSLLESGVKDAIVIIDKGFASEKNIKALEDEELKFIIPLPRKSSYIDYGKIKTGDKSLYEGYFRYQGRYIWFYCGQADEKKRVLLFLDEELRNREENDYLNRIESKAQDYSIEKFHGKRHAFGTIAIIENTGKIAEEVYCLYKSRGEVETMIDALKNILDADRTCMQNAQTLEGWMFVNLVALKCYYITLNLLKKHGLNRKFSPQDLFLFLSELKKVKINNDWHNTESTKKTAELLKIIGIIPIT